MIDIIPRSLLVRLGLACVVLGFIWIGLVKPAYADLEADRLRLETQQQEVDTHAASTADLIDLQRTADTIRSTAERLQADLDRHTSSKEILAKIESVAKAENVRISRSEPLGDVRIEVPLSEDEDPVDLIAVRVNIQFSTTYNSAIRFVNAIQHDIGISSIESIHLTPSGGQAVAGSVEIKVFRLDPKSADIFSTEQSVDED